jgi:putative DNA primase/helicase
MSAKLDVNARHVFEYAPLDWARAFIESEYTDSDNCRLLHHWRGDFWHYNGVCYEIKDRQTLRADLYDFLDQCAIIGEQGPERAKPKKGDIEKFIDALEASVHRLPSEDAPAWVDGTPPELLELPISELLVCTNGLLHIPTRRLLEPTPRLFATSLLNVRYDKDAPEPKRWMQFLDELWGGDRETNDAETILALQLVFAYLLSGYTREQKIIFLVGIRRSGKGTIARLLTALFGRDMVCNPTFQSIGERFGGENLIGKSIAIIGDARLSGRTDIQTCVERLLSISGEDHQSVQRKNKPDWNGRLNFGAREK